MRTDIKIPPAGDKVKSCQLAKWHREDSSQVQRGEIILTLETDKVSQDLEATFTGTLRHVSLENSTATIGECVGYIEHDGSEINEVIEELDQNSVVQYEADPETSLLGELFMIFKYALMILGVFYLVENAMKLFLLR